MLFPRRIHAVELLDHPRCPRVVRDGALDYLQFIIRTGNAYGPATAPLENVLRICGEARIVDLCSGGGGPWPHLRSQLVAAGAPSNLHVTLTDLFPNVDAYSLILARDNHVSGDVRPVDIERDVIAARGVRTLFSSFHHFNPATAARVLNNLSRTGDPIFIAEGTHRSALAIFFMLLAPLFVWLATPMLRPFKWSRLALTYLVPVIPFVVCFDGIVSCLRTYTVDELRALLRTLDDLRYEWTVAEAHGSAPMPVTYAIGVPKARRS